MKSGMGSRIEDSGGRETLECPTGDERATNGVCLELARARGSHDPRSSILYPILRHGVLRRLTGGICRASRYLDTVRRAHSMPCSVSISEIWLSDSGY